MDLLWNLKKKKKKTGFRGINTYIHIKMQYYFVLCMYTWKAQNSCTLPGDAENKLLKRRVSAYTQRDTFSTKTHQREGCLTVPGGPMWFGTVILLWHLWSLLPNPNFKQTLLTCSMFLGRSCKSNERHNRKRERERHDEGEGEKEERKGAMARRKRGWVNEKAD